MGRHIAIIGGGASAALLLAHLARSGAKDISVDVYDRTGRFSKGIAYSTKHDCHLLNVRAANMSAYQDDKDHFAHWAAARGYAPSDFVPRKLYGQYLAERVEEAAKVLNIRFIEKDIKDAQELTGYDRVVLASGNVRALSPCVGERVNGYYDDPWSVDFAALKNAKEIALVGSGLTAVDAVLALEANGYKGNISIFSRNALLPASHIDPVSYTSFLTAENERLSPLRLLCLIRQTIKQAGVPWHAVIDSLRPHTNTIWANWSGAERSHFSKRLLTFWNVHRHRMAPQIAATVERLRTEGRLKLIRARVNAVTAGPAIDSAAGYFTADAVINCLGYRYDEAGRAYEGCERIGPANFGALFETTAIPEIRAQAHALAQKIAQ